MLVEGHINLLDLIITENDYRKIERYDLHMEKGKEFCIQIQVSRNNY